MYPPSRSSVLTYGMWDQIRVDKGREFSLTLFIQERLCNHRQNVNRQPYVQSTSKAVRMLYNVTR